VTYCPCIRGYNLGNRTINSHASCTKSIWITMDPLISISCTINIRPTVILCPAIAYPLSLRLGERIWKDILHIPYFNIITKYMLHASDHPRDMYYYIKATNCIMNSFWYNPIMQTTISVIFLTI